MWGRDVAKAMILNTPKRILSEGEDMSKTKKELEQELLIIQAERIKRFLLIDSHLQSLLRSYRFEIKDSEFTKQSQEAVDNLQRLRDELMDVARHKIRNCMDLIDRLN